MRYVYSNDDLSRRVKFILVSWVGPSVKVMRKARVSVHLAEVKQIIKSFAVEIQASEKSELKEEEVVKLIKRAGGANYDRQASNY